MNSSKRSQTRALKHLCYATLGLVTALDLLLWSVSPIDPLENETMKDLVRLTLLLGAICAVFRTLYPRFEPQITMPWLRTVAEHAFDGFELLLFYRWVPAAITFAGYLVLPYSLPLADRWLAWPEVILGLPHWRTYTLAQSIGAMPIFRQIYASIDIQLVIMLIFFAFAHRNLHRMWEYTAAVSVTGALSIAFLWALPAEGPWAQFNELYTALPPEPAYLIELKHLRAGTLTDHTTMHGMLSFPSFHTVFAMLIAWTFRGQGLLSIAVWLLDLLVIVATVPVGWHYLTDIAGGIAMSALGVWIVSRLSRARSG